MRQFSFATPPECGLDEDCLYLNVWRPAEAEPHLPVIVYVYGGGHRVGSGSHPVSHGESLARQGAVVVTVNYRLGALGYLAHPDLTREQGASGNYACLDLLASLEWVQRNISALGGDPGCVTVFGQSAGASLLTVLMASKRARGLFHRAIVHSGGRFNGSAPGQQNIRDLADAEAAGLAMARAAGAMTPEQLRALPPEALNAPRGFWGPIIDGEVLTEAPDETFKRGGQAEVSLMAGFTANEGAPYPVPGIRDKTSFDAYLANTYGSEAAHVHSLYPCTTDAAAVSAAYDLKRDSHFAYQAWACATLHARADRGDTYLFVFEQALPLPEGRRFHEERPPDGYGAFHGAELWYAFDNLALGPWPWRARDHEVASAMSAAWVAFARTGRPTAPGLPDWPRLAPGLQEQAMVMGAGFEVRPPANLEALRFFSRRHLA